MSGLLHFPIKKDFNPEQTRVMGEAFDLVRQYARHSGRTNLDTAEARDIIAHRILEKAATGESDPAKLAEHAITFLAM